LAEWFSSREGHSPSGFLVKELVSDKFIHHILGSYFLSDDFPRAWITIQNTFTANSASGLISDDFAIDNRNRPFRAGIQAGLAAQAAFCSKDQLSFKGLALRIVAPAAGQRTAFHKNGGANSRTVMNGKPFDVEDQAC